MQQQPDRATPKLRTFWAASESRELVPTCAHGPGGHPETVGGPEHLQAACPAMLHLTPGVEVGIH